MTIDFARNVVAISSGAEKASALIVSPRTEMNWTYTTGNSTNGKGCPTMNETGAFEKRAAMPDAPKCVIPKERLTERSVRLPLFSVLLCCLESMYGHIDGSGEQMLTGDKLTCEKCGMVFTLGEDRMFRPQEILSV